MTQNSSAAAEEKIVEAAVAGAKDPGQSCTGMCK